MTSDLTTKAAEIRAGLVADWRKAMEGVPEGPWTHEPWHISEGPPMVHVKEGWLLCAVPADDHARWIARCSPAGISDLLNLIEQRAAELAEARADLTASRELLDRRTQERDREAERADGNYEHYRDMIRERDELLREKERLTRRLDRLTGNTEMVMVNGAGFAAAKPVAQRLAELTIKLDQACALGMAYSADAKSAEGALIAIRRRAIFGPSLSTSDLLDLTAGVAGVSCADRLCPHAPTYDAGLCCGHPDDCTFISPAALAPLGEE